MPLHIELSDKLEEDGEYFPVALQNEEGESALGVFSSEEEAGDHYEESDGVVLIDIPFTEVIDFFMDTEDLSVIVLDAFTEPLVISRELAELIAACSNEGEEA